MCNQHTLQGMLLLKLAMGHCVKSPHVIYSTENMAWFEVNQLILRSVSEGTEGEWSENSSGETDDKMERRKHSTCTLVVQYNPTGIVLL